MNYDCLNAHIISHSFMLMDVVLMSFMTLGFAKKRTKCQYCWEHCV